METTNIIAPNVSQEALKVANKFVELSKRDNVADLTPLKIQKLLYLAQGRALALFGEPIFPDDVDAWKYGPVVRGLYSATKTFGQEPIDRYFCEIEGTEPKFDNLESRFSVVVEQTWNEYKSKSGEELIEETHRGGAPWSQTKPNTAIPNALTQAFFKTELADKITREEKLAAFTADIFDRYDETFRVLSR